MLEVRHDRRIYLCKILSYIGTSFLLIFGILSIREQHYLIGGVLLCCMLAGYINLYVLYKRADINLSVNVLSSILIILSITLLITGGVENTGILWIYPIIAISLYINRFWSAVWLSIFFVVISCALLFTPLSDVLLVSYSFNSSIRFVLTIVALCLICLAALHSEEKAYKTILQLHNDDMRKMAYYDSLTGLPNRWSFITNFKRILQRASKDNQRVGLLYIDLDNFKQVNDNFGHEIADQLLCIFSEKLREVIRPTDLIVNQNINELARLAGDEFVVVLNDLDSTISAGIIAKRILAIFDNGLDVAGITHSVYASIGIATFPEDATQPGDLLHYADLTMYEAKRNGKNRFEFYTEEIANKLREHHHIEESLKLALQQNLFSLVYMPLYDCVTLEVVGIEVLLRCENLMTEGIGPDLFIPVAEKTSLIKEIDLWVIENSVIDLIELQSKDNFKGKFCINISGVELQNEHFATQVRALFEKYQVVPSTIEFEITETAFVLNSEKSIVILEDLRNLGVSLALDDFGTGYTAFSQLIHYPADCLKIDRSFVDALFSDKVPLNKMVPIIKSLAELYELRVVAEGVETKEQLEYLQNIGCDWVQGYFLSRPLPLHDLKKEIV